MQLTSKSLIRTSLFILTVAAASWSYALDQADHAVITPQQMQWAAGPDALPKGAQVVLLEGNPAKEGPFTLRLKFPANYKIPPHWHPVIEHVTVLSGEFYLGMGDQFDEKKAMKLPTGSFAFMPPEMHHFAFTHKGAVVQLHGMGPWGITYINPQDDPRNEKK